MGFGIRVFDTVLDGGNLKDTSSRHSAGFWREFCHASNWSFSYERIHSLKDLSFFLNRTIKENVIIFSGHGYNDGWHMTNGDILNADSLANIRIHANNLGKDIIFSSCLMARNDDMCKSLKNIFCAKRLFAYNEEVQDRICFLNESILLMLIAKKLSKQRNFAAGDFLDFKENTNFMKTLNKRNARVHPMEMYY